MTGLNITQTVNNLMQVDSQPVTQLTNEDTQLQQQATAYSQLSAELLALQYDAKALQQSSLYTATSATSSNSSAPSATVTGTPVERVDVLRCRRCNRSSCSATVFRAKPRLWAPEQSPSATERIQPNPPR